MPVEMTAIREALRLTEMGLFCFPVKPGAKVPAVVGWQRRRRPYAEPMLRRWFEQCPDANLGLRTGLHVEGRFHLIVVDVNPRNGGDGSLRQLRKEYDLPESTPTARTPSGGLHLIYGSLRPIGCHTGLLPGIDIKGEGGMIVVEPSRVRDRDYVWARPLDLAGPGCPVELDGRLALRLEEVTRQRLLPSQPDEGRLILPIREGDEASLASEMIGRFPIARPGQWHARMAPVILSLLGRGYDVPTTRAVVMLWTGHFHRAGRCRTSPASGEKEIDAAIAYTLANDRMVRSRSEVDHDAAIAEIRLTDRQRSLIRAPIHFFENSASPGGAGLCKGDTRASRRLSVALCTSLDEEAFVEALVVQAIHNRDLGRPDIFTDRQLAEIARARHGIVWDKTQLRRLRQKYIDDPIRLATVLPLMRCVERGVKRIKDGTSRPSRYEPLNLVAFLDPGVSSVSAA